MEFRKACTYKNVPIVANFMLKAPFLFKEILSIFYVTMRLLTHNLIQCVKCNNDGFPLRLVVENADDMTECECAFDPSFMQHILDRLDLACITETVNRLPLDIEVTAELPTECPSGTLPEEDLENLHRVLNCYEIIKGTMTCPSCAQVYEINDRIPNMIVL